jgi:hypothetical protein
VKKVDSAPKHPWEPQWSGGKLDIITFFYHGGNHDEAENWFLRMRQKEKEFPRQWQTMFLVNRNITTSWD